MYTFQAINKNFRKDHETASRVLFIQSATSSAEESWNNIDEETEEKQIWKQASSILASNEKGVVFTTTLKDVSKGGNYYVSEGSLNRVVSKFHNKQAEAILAFETGSTTPEPINTITKKKKALSAVSDDTIIATITAYKTHAKKPSAMETKIHEKLAFLTGRTNLFVQKITKTRLKEYFGGTDKYQSGYYVSETQFLEGFLLEFATKWMEESVYLDHTLAAAKWTLEKMDATQAKISAAFNLVIGSEGSASDEEIQDCVQKLTPYCGQVWLEGQSDAKPYEFVVNKTATNEEIQTAAQNAAFELVHFECWSDDDADDDADEVKNALPVIGKESESSVPQLTLSQESDNSPIVTKPVMLLLPLLTPVDKGNVQKKALIVPFLLLPAPISTYDGGKIVNQTCAQKVDLPILGDRTKYLGASEFGAVCGVSKFASPIDVYMRKVGLVSDPVENAVMKRGKQAEAYIGKLYEERTGHTLSDAQKEFIYPEHDFLKCHVDWLDKKIPVDAKSVNVNRGKFERDVTTGNLTWGADGTDEVSHDCIVQAHGQMLLTGAKNAIMAVLFIDDDVFKKTKSLEKASSHEVGGDFRIYKIDYNQDVIDFMLPKLLDFWHNHVLPPIAPPFDFSRKNVLKTQVRVLNNNVTDEVKQLGQEEEALHIQIKIDEVEVRKAQKALNEAKARLETNQARLEAAIGDAQQGIIPNVGIYTRKRVNVKAFTRKEKKVEANSYIKTTFAQQQD